MSSTPSTASSETDARLLRLDSRDNLLTLTATIVAGTELKINGRVVMMAKDLTLGHKLAACDLPQGAKVIKYGAPIGLMTTDLKQGEHVQRHNLQSDHLPTFLHGTQEQHFYAKHSS